MGVLALRMNLTSGESKGMEPETGFLGVGQRFNTTQHRNPVSKLRVLSNGNNSYLRRVRDWARLLS